MNRWNEPNYIVLGSDNKWYAYCQTIEEANNIVKELSQKFQNEEERPSDIYIFSSEQISVKEIV